MQSFYALLHDMYQGINFNMAAFILQMKQYTVQKTFRTY